jgi:hypothetical protein
MPRSQSKDLCEIFGFTPDDLTPECRNYWAREICPFIGTQCTKFNHDKSVIYGVCLYLNHNIPQGGSWRDIPFDLLPTGLKRARRSDHTKRYGRLDPNGICSTILTKCDPHWGSFFHPTQERTLTVREAARIQSFPDSFRFLGSLTEQYDHSLFFSFAQFRPINTC